ncbi:MAG: dihydroorotase family protein, partial [Candidatus Pacebacteria bacterium]|nr:dihydroorotase family protein [Candidatus Paceibacterota bacterium]
AKSEGLSISAGVCPHHLYMTGEARERLKGLAIMKPPLGTPEDQAALWAGLVDGTIDMVETDHAPHTREEKEKSEPAFGVTGLETSLSLMWKAVQEGKIAEERLVEVMYSAAKKVFNIPEQADTYIEVDTDATWVVGVGGYESKANSSPFEGMELPGVVKTVVIRGKTIVENGTIL